MKNFKKIIKPINLTNWKLNILSSTELEKIVGSIGLKFLQVEHVGLCWKNS